MYTNRTQAGKRLANLLGQYKGTNSVVLAIPRGGVPVACAVAEQLHLPLDLLLVKKIPHPGYPEYAIGATSLDDYFVANPELISRRYIEHTVQKIREDLAGKRLKFMDSIAPQVLQGKNVIIVDDGAATGLTLLAAVKVVQSARPAKIIVAVPVASKTAATLLLEEADEFTAPLIPADLHAVGNYYADFSQVQDSEVAGYLRAFSQTMATK